MYYTLTFRPSESSTRLSQRGRPPGRPALPPAAPPPAAAFHAATHPREELAPEWAARRRRACAREELRGLQQHAQRAGRGERRATELRAQPH